MLGESPDGISRCLVTVCGSRLLIVAHCSLHGVLQDRDTQFSAAESAIELDHGLPEVCAHPARF